MVSRCARPSSFPAALPQGQIATSIVKHTKNSRIATLAALGVTALVSATLPLSSATAGPSPATTPTSSAVLGGVSALAADKVALGDGLVEHVGGWQVANAEAHTYGRLVSTLVPHQGRIFAGHGNYSANSGSTPVNDGTDIGSYDPVTGSHVTEMKGFTTEEVMVYREIDGALYAPNVDPTGAQADQPYVTNASGSWGYAGETVPDVIHIYDIAELDGEWFLFGAGYTETRGQAGTVQAAATIWSSPDGLTDWTIAHQAPETPANYDGYERFYWGATHDGTLYAAATEGTRGTTPPMVQYRDGVWSDVPASTPANSWLEYVGAQFAFSTDRGVVFANSDQVNLFDGEEFTTLPLDGRYIQGATLGADGDLRLLTSDGTLSRLDLETMTLSTVWQGTDPVLGSVMAMTLLDGTLYLSAASLDGSSNRMVTLQLPAEPAAPGDGEPATPGDEEPGEGDGETAPTPPKSGHPHGKDRGHGKAHGKDKPKHSNHAKGHAKGHGHAHGKDQGKQKPQPGKAGKK